MSLYAAVLAAALLWSGGALAQEPDWMGTVSERVPKVLDAAAIVSASGAVSPSMIGADDKGFTQVELAQAKPLNLAGTGVRVGWLTASGIDYLNNDFLGKCTAVGQPAATCRVVIGYNQLDKDKPPLPPTTPVEDSDAGDEVFEGNYNAGIIAGSFSQKLRDANGTELSFQRGVAYNALIGVYKYDGRRHPFAVYDIAPVPPHSMEVLGLAGGFAYPVIEDPEWWASQHNITMIAMNIHVPRGDNRLHQASYPAGFDSRISVAGVQNTVLPGAAIQVNRDITIKAGPKNPTKTQLLNAWARLDTRKSMTNGTFSGDLPAPMLAADCSLFNSSAATARALVNELLKNATQQRPVLVINCHPFPLGQKTNSTIYELMRKAVAVLVVAPRPSLLEQDIPARQLPAVNVPVFWLETDHGAALWSALATPGFRIRVEAVVAMLVPQQSSLKPSPQSGWGPTITLNMKPDFSAPVSLYSSLGYGAFGVSVSEAGSVAYAVGAVALWKEHRKKQIQAGQYSAPTEGWTMRAKQEFKLSARPMEWQKGLLWPVARVGTGIIQVYNAVINRVLVQPFEIPLPSATARHTRELTLTNAYDKCDMTYVVKHLPAASINLASPWYLASENSDTNTNFLETVTAQVTLPTTPVTVPKKGSVKVSVTITLPTALTAKPYLYSGIILFEAQKPCTAGGPERINLAVPYQGSSREFSSAVQVPVFYSQLPANGMPPSLRAQDGKMCVLPSSYFSPAYWSYDSLTVVKPTCAPDQSGKWPDVIRATLAAMQDFRLCIAVERLRPVVDMVLRINKQESNGNGSFVPFGFVPYGLAGGSPGGAGVQCLTWRGGYTSINGTTGLTMPEDERAVYQIIVETAGRVPAADRDRITKPEAAQVVLQQLLLVVPPPNNGTNTTAPSPPPTNNGTGTTAPSPPPTNNGTDTTAGR